MKYSTKISVSLALAGAIMLSSLTGGQVYASVNSYASSFNSATQNVLNTWIQTRIVSRKATLSPADYASFIERLSSKLGVIMNNANLNPKHRTIYGYIQSEVDAIKSTGTTSISLSTPTCTTDPVAYYYYYNPDVKNAGADAIGHWNDFGMKEGRKSCWSGVQTVAAVNGGGGGGGSSTAATTGVPVVTIKATPFSNVISSPGDLVLITWTATNSPSYCTGLDGGKSSWKNGKKLLPSTAASYSQMIDLTEFYESPVDYTFSITCTNAYGTSQIASTILKDTQKVYGTHAGPASNQDNWPSSWPLAWKKGDGKNPAVWMHRQIDDAESIKTYNSRSVQDVLNAGSDVKICKRVFPFKTGDLRTVFIIANPTTSPPCTEDSDFITLMGQSGWTYNNPNNPYFKMGIKDVFTRSHVGGYSSYTDLNLNQGTTQVQVPSDVLNPKELYSAEGKLVPLDFHIGGTFPEQQIYVFKSSNGGIFSGYWGYIGGFGSDYGDAWTQIPDGPPVTKFSAESSRPNEVTLTWSSTKFPAWCYAYPNGVEGWGDGPPLSLKSAPTSTDKRSQTLTIEKPGTYTFEMRCMNGYSIGYPVSATVTVTGQNIGNP